MSASRRETFSQFPYPGLRPFDPRESDIFFGRDAQIDELLSRLSQTRFLAVVGPSGCGKSSVVAAGMLPALAGGFMAGTSAQWAIARMRPGEHPFSRLAEVLLRETPLGETLDPNSEDFSEECAMMEAFLRRGPLGLVEALRGTPLDQRGKPEVERTKLLVLVDQFEEIFRYGAEERRRRTDDEKDAFVALLLESKSQQEFPIFVAITMRSDFIGDCSVFPGLPETINDGLYLTPRLTRSECREAIIGPAELFGATIEPALVNRLLNESGSDPDQLPLLQHLLMRMWRKRFGGTDTPVDSTGKEPVIGMAQYESPSIGGFNEALTRHLDHVYDDYLNDEQKRLAKILFKALCERRGNQNDIRRPTAVGTIAGIANVSWKEIVDVVEVFRQPGRNFVTPRRGGLEEETILDISHESLIRNWKRLREWVEQEAESARQYNRLEQTAILWEKGEANLWRGVDLETALQWEKQERPVKAWAERYGSQFLLAMKFLDSSRIRRAWRLVGCTAIVLTAIFLFAGGVLSHLELVDNVKENLRRNRLNNLSLHLLGLFDSLSDPEETGRMAAVDVSTECLRTEDAVEQGALIGLRLALDYFQNRAGDPAPENRIPLLRNPEKPDYFLTIQDERTLVLWYQKKVTKISRIWSSGVPKGVEEFRLKQPIHKIGFSNDGTRSGVECEDGNVFIWDFADPPTDSEPSALVLEDALDLSGKERKDLVRTAPGVRELVVEVASHVMREYESKERDALGLPPSTDFLSDHIVNARKRIEGNVGMEEAIKPITDIGFDEEEAKRILCMSFVNEGNRLMKIKRYEDAKNRYELARRVNWLSKNEINDLIALTDTELARKPEKADEVEKKYAREGN